MLLVSEGILMLPFNMCMNVFLSERAFFYFDYFIVPF